MDLPYQPFWCEENAWQLCRDPRIPGRRHVLFVTGVSGERVLLWAQVAARKAHDPVAWDYHVIVLAETDGVWTAWDADCRLGPSVPAARWLEVSFPCPQQVPADLQPRFRLIASEDYLARFSTDRSHMRDPCGGWLHPPPPWPPPGDGRMNLDDWRAPSGGRGTILDLATLRSLIDGPG